MSGLYVLIVLSHFNWTVSEPMSFDECFKRQKILYEQALKWKAYAGLPKMICKPLESSNDPDQ